MFSSYLSKSTREDLEEETKAERTTTHHQINLWKTWYTNLSQLLYSFSMSHSPLNFYSFLSLSLSLLTLSFPCLRAFFGFFCPASAISHHRPFQVPPSPPAPFSPFSWKNSLFALLCTDQYH